MRSVPRSLCLGWFFLHFLLIGLICVHESLWLLGQQLTVAPRSSSRVWRRIDSVSATLLGDNVGSNSFFARAIATYTNAAGIEVGYGYFAPNVPETHAVVFELHYPDGHVDYDTPVLGSQEGELRLTSLVEQIGRTDYEKWRNELMRRLARSIWQRHPTAVSIRCFFGSVTPPTLAVYRSGKNERTFTCQYIYDFKQTPREHKGGEP
jgi:hypothetical protein